MAGGGYAGVAGGLPHGGAVAAVRGCGCGKWLAELGGEPPAQLELELGLPSAAPPAAPRLGVRLLPAGLVPAAPAGMDAMAASQARQDVLAAAAGEAEAAERLVRLGLAASAPAAGCWNRVRTLSRPEVLA